MNRLAKLFLILGVLVLLAAVLSRFVVGRPYLLLGVRALSLIVISNTFFLLAIIIKVFSKK